MAELAIMVVGEETVVNLDREPTADEMAGMEWWNSMSEPRRADWLRLADSARPADAWAEFKRRSLEDQPGATSAG